MTILQNPSNSWSWMTFKIPSLFNHAQHMNKQDTNRKLSNGQDMASFPICHLQTLFIAWKFNAPHHYTNGNKSPENWEKTQILFIFIFIFILKSRNKKTANLSN